MPKMLDSANVAEAMGLHVRTVRRMMRDGTIPGVKIGRKWFISDAVLESMVNGGRNEAVTR